MVYSHTQDNFYYFLIYKFQGYLLIHLLQSDNDWAEWQADSLAAALLMPREPFMEAARDELGMGLSCYRGRMDSFQYFESLARIAKQFQVSKNAACIRLKQLGLIRSVA